MKIICTQENLKNGLLVVGRIISSNLTLPILNNILLKTENGMLKLSSTNLEIAITTHIRCKVESEGEVTVNNKTFIELVNNLPNTNLQLETSGGGLKIEAENFHTEIKTLSAEEFPLIPEVESQEKFTISAPDFKEAVSQVAFAASTNQTQPEISGVFMGLDEQGLRLAATDRYRLAEKKLSLQNPQRLIQEIILPHKTATEVSRIIGNQTGELQISFGGNQIVFIFQNTSVVSRVVDGQYPPYQQIIPQTFNTTVVTKKAPFISALKAGGIFSQNGNSVKLDYLADSQKLVLSSESGDLGKNVVELPSAVEGQSGQLILNYHYILDCLNSIDAEEVVLKIIDDNSPTLLNPKTEEGMLYLIMPIKN